MFTRLLRQPTILLISSSLYIKGLIFNRFFFPKILKASTLYSVQFWVFQILSFFPHNFFTMKMIEGDLRLSIIC